MEPNGAGTKDGNLLENPGIYFPNRPIGMSGSLCGFLRPDAPPPQPGLPSSLPFEQVMLDRSSGIATLASIHGKS